MQHNIHSLHARNTFQHEKLECLTSDDKRSVPGIRFAGDDTQNLIPFTAKTHTLH
jgi:hypothetical protein